MNKLLKFIPAALLTITASTGCSNGKNKLQAFVDGLKDGELTADDLGGLFEEGVLESGDKELRYSDYSMNDYSPYWAFNEGQDESVYEEYVHDLTTSETFRSYDNDVVVTTTNYKCYPYDKSTITEDDNEGLAKKPISYKGKGHIYEDAGELNYIYTQDGKADDAYSFKHSVESNKALKEHFTKGGGFGANVVAGIADVEDTYAYYASGASEDAIVHDEFSAKKEDGKLSINFDGYYDWRIYSAERCWGWTYADDDTEYEHPLTKETSDYDGQYVQMGLKFEYAVSIEKGIISSAHMYYVCYYRILFADKNYVPGSPVPDFEPSDEAIAAMDLYIPEKVHWDGQDMNNPYTGKGYLVSLPHTVESFNGSSESLGDYDKTNLPKIEKYRECDSIDNGAWFDVHEMDEEY